MGEEFMGRVGVGIARMDRSQDAQLVDGERPEEMAGNSGESLAEVGQSRASHFKGEVTCCTMLLHIALEVDSPVSTANPASTGPSL